MNSRIYQSTYDELFKNDPKILKEALKQACEIRKFEIDLYWKRATYFWTFIGASFVGYAAYFNTIKDNPDGQFILVLIACVGFVFSVAWHFVNKGSKFWQENWENHVELLEDAVFGPLYKTITRRPLNKTDNPYTFKDKVKNFFVDPSPYSVSKINQLVSTYIAIIWGFILWSSVGEKCITGCTPDWHKALPVGLSLFTCVGFWWIGKSHQGSHDPQVFTRKTTVDGEPG